MKLNRFAVWVVTLLATSLANAADVKRTPWGKTVEGTPVELY